MRLVASGLTWLAIFSMAAPPAARAADIDTLKLGPVIHGPKITEKDLYGKVVLAEQWGYR